MALADDHVRLTDWPAGIVAGTAESEIVGGRGTGRGTGRGAGVVGTAIVMLSHKAASSNEPMPTRPAPKVASFACMITAPSALTVMSEPARETSIW